MSERETLILWTGKLRDNLRGDALLPAEYPLVLLADRQLENGARLTKQFSLADGLWLTMSLPVGANGSAADSTVRSFNIGAAGPSAAESALESAARVASKDSTRVRLAVGAVIWVLSGEESVRTIASVAFEHTGFKLEMLSELAGLAERAASEQPAVILIDPKLAGSKQLAFSARAAGYRGQTIALRPIQGGAAIAASFDAVCEVLSASTLASLLLA